VGGVPDVVRHDETGWLVPSSDANALAETIKIALSDKGAVAARAQTDVLQRFSKERLIKDTETLYESLLEKHRLS
jgi:glycosyltransferase involved in cell wall biosynthesis